MLLSNRVEMVQHECHLFFFYQDFNNEIAYLGFYFICIALSYEGLKILQGTVFKEEYNKVAKHLLRGRKRKGIK